MRIGILLLLVGAIGLNLGLLIGGLHKSSGPTLEEYKLCADGFKKSVETSQDLLATTKKLEALVKASQDQTVECQSLTMQCVKGLKLCEEDLGLLQGRTK